MVIPLALTLNVDTFVRMFLEVQSLFDVLPQQIPDLLIVDFKVGRMDQILVTLRHLNRLKDVVKSSVKIITIN